MVTLLLLGLGSAFISIGLTVQYLVYHRITPKEIKRRARRGDVIASRLYKSAAYGLQLYVLLIITAGLFGCASLLLLSHAIGDVQAVMLVAVLTGITMLIISTHGMGYTAIMWISARMSPLFSWVLNGLQPVTVYALHLVKKLKLVSVHTGLYEKSDLLTLLERQKKQPDNRIEPNDMELLLHVLTFGERCVRDIVVPRRVVKQVAADDTIGPILMDELHVSGHSSYPVYDGNNPENIVGIVHVRDIIDAKHGEPVRDIMRHQLTYVHEDFTLHQALQAFLKTRQHLALVVDAFEEYMGIITVEDVLEQIIGKPITDEFDQYENLRAVAKAAARHDHAKHISKPMV
jgi:CBS domain containing-hemolysin-like protein